MFVSTSKKIEGFSRGLLISSDIRGICYALCSFGLCSDCMMCFINSRRQDGGQKARLIIQTKGQKLYVVEVKIKCSYDKILTSVVSVEIFENLFVCSVPVSAVDVVTEAEQKASLCWR